MLLGLDAGGGDSREGWRQFAFATLQPVPALLKAELDRIGLSAPVSFERLGAADIGTRARAYQSLTRGGMDKARAAEIAGF